MFTRQSILGLPKTSSGTTDSFGDQVPLLPLDPHAQIAEYLSNCLPTGFGRLKSPEHCANALWMAAVPLQMLGQGIPGNLFTPLKCILCGNSCGIKLREVSSGWKDLGRADDVSTIAPAL